jgi:hypothetical protein
MTRLMLISENVVQHWMKYESDYELEGTYMEVPMVHFKIVLMHHECYTVMQHILLPEFL